MIQARACLERLLTVWYQMAQFWKNLNLSVDVIRFVCGDPRATKRHASRLSHGILLSPPIESLGGRVLIEAHSWIIILIYLLD